MKRQHQPVSLLKHPSSRIITAPYETSESSLISTATTTIETRPSVASEMSCLSEHDQLATNNQNNTSCDIEVPIISSDNVNVYFNIYCTEFCLTIIIANWLLSRYIIVK